MAVLIGTSTKKQVFNKAVIKIGSGPDCDFAADIGPECLILQYSQNRKKYILTNRFENKRILFKGVRLSDAIILEDVLKVTVEGTSEYIIFKMVELPQDKQQTPKNTASQSTEAPSQAQSSSQAQAQAASPQAQSSPQAQAHSVTPQNPSQNLQTPSYPPSSAATGRHAQKIQQDYAQNNEKSYEYNEQDLKNIYGEDSDISTKVKIEHQKAKLEKLRSPIIKQVGFAINDIKNRLSLNNKASIFVHIALVLSSIVTAFGVSNFITGLKIEETQNFINLPTNIKILVLFSVIVYGLGLILKQGAFLYFQNKKYPSNEGRAAEKFLLFVSGILFTGIYTINLIYYLSINPAFSILMSLFFVGLSVVLALSAGYFKNSGHMLSYELDKYEYREDFESVMNEYRLWINKYINSLSETKLSNLKDRLFNLQLKSAGEILLGIITAPFLAYGVSNTLAMCFPEAAGWIRISGLRFSPVFLVLATFLIIFAFFSFVNAFLSVRKVQASQVIKHDGFSDYLNHGTDILGIQGVRKLESEKIRCLVIGCAIIFIEFTMNTSYFCTEIGGDLQGILLSVIAALVPTALLMAETYMLSQTKYDISAISDLLAKKD